MKRKKSRDNRFKKDEKFMALALNLAEKGRARTSPNPMVGAVVVKNGRIIGKGYHKKAGMPHAEAIALDDAGTAAKGATLYVNLEPCNHFGRTPPCCDKILINGIKEVVIGMRDPNPINNGSGIRRLKKNGIKLRSGIMEEEAKRLNEAYIKFITTKMPFVTIKVAESLDGKIATRTGDSKWITGSRARKYAHRLRSQNDAIMVGINTILKDNPLLNVRGISKKKDPIKVIVDSRLRVPARSRIFSSRSPAKVLIATTQTSRRKKMRSFQGHDVEIIKVKNNGKGVDLKALFRELAGRGVRSLLVEGGGRLIGSLLENKLVDKAYFFISPKIIGGKEAVTSCEGRGVARINNAAGLKDIKIRHFGGDIMVEGYVHRNS